MRQTPLNYLKKHLVPLKIKNKSSLEARVPPKKKHGSEEVSIGLGKSVKSSKVVQIENNKMKANWENLTIMSLRIKLNKNDKNRERPAYLISMKPKTT